MFNGSMEDKYVSVERLLRDRLGNKVPGWAIWLARHILHEKWLNKCIDRGYTGIDFAEDTSKNYLNVKVKVEGLENLDPNGRYTIVANHSQGGNDSLALLYVFGRHLNGDVRIMANELLMELKPLRSCFVAVDKMRVTKDASYRSLSQQTDAIFNSDASMILYPAGRVSRRKHGKIQDVEWHKTFVTKSVQFQRDVVPVHFYGRNTWRFYFLDWLGSVTGINKKVPLSTLVLVDELKRTKNKSYRMVIGKPIPWTVFDNSRRPAEWAAWVKELVYSL